MAAFFDAYVGAFPLEVILCLQDCEQVLVAVLYLDSEGRSFLHFQILLL